MCQAPYGTGIFLTRKGMIAHSGTSAKYGKGNNFTLIGSRSAANAIAVWMILSKHGPYRWIQKKLSFTKKRTAWLCNQLTDLEIEYYLNSFSNIMTMTRCDSLDKLRSRFGLVPDDYEKPTSYKIVVMENVSIEKLELFITELELEIVQKLEPA